MTWARLPGWTAHSGTPVGVAGPAHVLGPPFPWTPVSPGRRVEDVCAEHTFAGGEETGPWRGLMKPQAPGVRTRDASGPDPTQGAALTRTVHAAGPPCAGRAGSGVWPQGEPVPESGAADLARSASAGVPLARWGVVGRNRGAARSCSGAHGGRGPGSVLTAERELGRLQMNELFPQSSGTKAGRGGPGAGTALCRARVCAPPSPRGARPAGPFTPTVRTLSRLQAHIKPAPGTAPASRAATEAGIPQDEGRL